MSKATTGQLVRLAWDVLPAVDRQVLEQLGADNWEIVSGPLGAAVDARLRSAGEQGSDSSRISADNAALGMWVPELRLVLINEEHSELPAANEATREALVTWVAWHEWGHALSLVSISPHDPSEGERLLKLAPPGVRERIRRSNYSRRTYVHELIAETYALLMRERVEGRSGRPLWLPTEIYNLMARVGTAGHSGASR